MNETMQSILTRRSVRSYKPDMIPEDVLERILKAGTYAATGMGRQSPIIIAVTDKTMRDKLSKMNAEVMGTRSTAFAICGTLPCRYPVSPAEKDHSPASQSAAFRKSSAFSAALLSANKFCMTLMSQFKFSTDIPFNAQPNAVASTGS